MKHLIFAFLISTSTAAVAVHAQVRAERIPEYNNNTQQIGYEHGYRDGADRGRQDRDRGVGRGLRQEDYLSSARYSYVPSYGNRREYMSAYQEGFQTGYDDGYNYYEREGRYSQIYGRRRTQNGAAAATNQPVGSRFDQGYRDGIATGQDDQKRNTRSDYRQSTNYRNGGRDYQDGYERGYQDGYGRFRYSTDGGGYYPNNSNTGFVDTRDGVGTPSRTIVVPSTNQWTSTGIHVNQGDRLQFQSSGEIQLRPANFNDRAGTAGSLQGRTAPNSPLPKALAGALIGRIDSGPAFGIGNQTTIVAPATGTLYLGINDDVLTDNSGEFRVTISW